MSESSQYHCTYIITDQQELEEYTGECLIFLGDDGVTMNILPTGTTTTSIISSTHPDQIELVRRMMSAIFHPSSAPV